jgi:hypothetical protein
MLGVMWHLNNVKSVLYYRLTLLVLIVESNWTSSNGRNYVAAVDKNSSNENNCWLHEEFEIVETCHPCTGKRIFKGFEL